MNIPQVNIVRVIAHEVVRASQFNEHQPVLSDRLLDLERKSLDLVGRRLVDTVASGSHCVDVTVEDAGAGSPFDKATTMIDADDHAFVVLSQQLARSLSTAQTAGPIKAGSAMFVQGTCLADGNPRRFLAIIKADSDQALNKRVKGESITLSYVSDMVLGESQRLIKIAFFMEEAENEGASSTGRKPEDFSVMVFDHLMQNSGDGNAAAYFYRTFLKCKLSHNAARQTKQFFEVVKSFIDEMAVSAADKVSYHGDLISYLRQNRSTIEPRTFAKDVLPEAQQDKFLRKCESVGIKKGFSKELELVKGKLRRQSVRFSSNVTLYAPSEVFRDVVKITGSTKDGWTELMIRGSVEAAP